MSDPPPPHPPPRRRRPLPVALELRVCEVAGLVAPSGAVSVTVREEEERERANRVAPGTTRVKAGS